MLRITWQLRRGEIEKGTVLGKREKYKMPCAHPKKSGRRRVIHPPSLPLASNPDEAGQESVSQTLPHLYIVCNIRNIVWTTLCCRWSWETAGVGVLGRTASYAGT